MRCETLVSGNLQMVDLWHYECCIGRYVVTANYSCLESAKWKTENRHVSYLQTKTNSQHQSTQGKFNHMLRFSSGCGAVYAIACPCAACGKVNMSQSFWDEAQKPPIKKTTRAKLEFCTGRFGAELLSYLLLLLQIVQGHGGKDRLDFNLEPTEGEGDAFWPRRSWNETCACALLYSALSLWPSCDDVFELRLGEQED